MIVELYTDDVSGWSPVMSVTSAVELAIELEDRGDSFSEIELSFAPSTWRVTRRAWSGR